MVIGLESKKIFVDQGRMDYARIDVLLRETSKILPQHEVRQLLAYALGTDLSELIKDGEVEVDPREFRGLVKRRMAQEPLQLILGSAGFWDFDVEVSRDTLIPRADSECLVAAALAACPQATGRVVDLGIGTGCLLLAFLRERPGWSGVGVDLSPAAVALAGRNARRAGVDDRTVLIAGSWGEALAGGFNLVLSNPPYIPHFHIARLASEVRDWEPSRALDGGADGFDAYRRILDDLPRLMVPGGVAVVELGIGQASDVAMMARIEGLLVDAIRPDLAGIERAIVLRSRLR